MIAPHDFALAVQRRARPDDQRGFVEIGSAHVVLGVEHILTGVDHLLFVIARKELRWRCKRARRREESTKRQLASPNRGNACR